jgi:hypothetical protein
MELEQSTPSTHGASVALEREAAYEQLEEYVRLKRRAENYLLTHDELRRLIDDFVPYLVRL